MNPEIKKVLDGKSEGCIVCGDCLEVMKDWPEKCVDLVLTDPPYNIGLNYSEGNDWMPFDVYENWCKEWFFELERLRLERGKIVIFVGHGNVDMWFRIRRPEGIGCWYKPGSPRHGGIFQWCEWEPFLIFDPSCRAIGGSDVIRCSLFNQQDTGNHPCPKPLPLFVQLIEKIRADLILDPFCGSGTTCVAAKMLGRRYIGIDISPEYCEIARQRLEAVDTGVSVKEQRQGQKALFE
jgi:site-specific DNA-methyltransferase (adenine-specific)